MESEGIRTGVFDSKLPNQFVLCMWTSGRRQALARHAVGYEALIVLGCDAAVETVQNCIKSNDSRVIPGMEVEGIMNVIPIFRFPFNIWLEVSSVTRVLQDYAGAFLPRSQNELIQQIPPPNRYFVGLHGGR